MILPAVPRDAMRSYEGSSSLQRSEQAPDPEVAF